ncbi:hypothetical protein P167DRAFT_577534 [Morchella conica CCBAS932]|uniref:Uncharacterized protein n=1 Tax=Morchella conica CCBAS932 TaxID=1392247 RepID=A0A3N4KIJ4_9PEZI|nr:hypothetical protein P167DRAFT_577534 [Morchella conica CCBAS932]
MADKNVDGVAISSTVLTAVGVIVAVLTLFSMLNLFRCLRRRKRLTIKGEHEFLPGTHHHFSGGRSVEIYNSPDSTAVHIIVHDARQRA